MTSEEYARLCEDAIRSVTDRVLSVGRKYTSTVAGVETQQFETMNPSEIIDMALEEVDDMLAYLVMFRYRVTELQARIYNTEGELMNERTDDNYRSENRRSSCQCRDCRA